MPPVLSVEVGEAKSGETRARRCPGSEKEFIAIPFRDEPTINTASHAFERASTKFKDRDFLGHRVYNDDGTRGEYTFQSFASCWTDCVKYGVAFRELLGLKSGSGSGDAQARIGIYSINRPEWTKTLFAAFSQRITVAPLYDTLGENAVKYIIDHAELTTVACEKSKMMNVAKGKGPTLKNVVVWEDVTADDKKEMEKFGLKLFSLSELASFADGFKGEQQIHPTPSDWAYIMYTSGTTGDPKGVILTHKNVLASSAALLNQSANVQLIRDDDVYISFLPLAHSFETCMQVSTILVGASIGFFCGDVRKLIGEDVPMLRPTVMAGVPRIYSRMFDKVTQGIEEKGGLAKVLYNWGMASNKSSGTFGFRRFIYNALLFKKIQAKFGGRIRLFASGAAPLSADLHHFLKTVFNCPVLQGYGMTENCAAAIVMPMGYDKGGNVGGPIPCLEVKLEDTDAYKSTDKYPASQEEFEAQVSFKGQFDPELAGKTVPRGEVCLRGENVFEGYYKNEKDTKETKDADGWLHTGDIGVWNADGSLSIVDRKKNIFKLAQGEYVSPEAVEIAIGSSKWALQAWVYGNSYENYVVVIVTPDIEVSLADFHPLTLISWWRGPPRRKAEA